MGPQRRERERERASDAVASCDEGRAVGRASGRLAACCRKSRAGWGAKLGHARCGPVREGSSGPKQAGRAVQLREGRRDRPPKQASVGKRKGKGAGWFGWAKMEEDEFFKVKSFSKSISSISQI